MTIFRSDLLAVEHPGAAQIRFREFCAHGFALTTSGFAAANDARSRRNRVIRIALGAC
jgi:hypothetical protein